ncbi:hypothetical protein QEN19_001957 [Hanseniaspora menglaensis]
MIIIGLTGGISTGKSTVSSYIQEQNKVKYGNYVAIVDADKISRQIVEFGKPAYKDIIKYFSNKIEAPFEIENDKTKEKQFDRAKLGKFVFAPGNEAHLKKLNSFTHPRVRKEIMLQIVKAHVKGYKICLLDVPLLFENPFLRKICYKTVSTIISDKNVQLNRLIKRNPEIPSEQLLNRIEAQKLTNSDRERMADYLIYNDSDEISYLFKQVDYLIETELLPISQTYHLMEWVFPLLGALSGLNIMMKNYFKDDEKKDNNETIKLTDFVDI